MTRAIGAALSAIPGWGPFLGELVSATIPNRRIERLETLVSTLTEELDGLQDDVKKDRITDPRFGDLFEETCEQSLRALTSERTRYLAVILRFSLTSDELKYEELQTSLKLLKELSDTEVVHVASFTERFVTDREFQKRHESILVAPDAYIGADQPTLDQYALFNNRLNRLERLSLIKGRYSRPGRGQVPEFDDGTGRMKSRGWDATALGELLIRNIEFSGASGA